MPAEITASIIIRTFNEEKHIGKLLSEISHQKVSFGYEIILVDSGSNDHTLEIIQNFPIHLVQIKPEDFTFGYSLNKGIEKSKGKYCVMISAHCFPANKFWLQNLIQGFENPKAAIVFGKQQGDERTKYSEHQIFQKLFPDSNNDHCAIPFCNNANCAIKKTVWLERKYNEALTGLEDLDLAKYVLKKNLYIVYRADAPVFHIHEETPKQIMNRYYREALAYKQIFKNEGFRFYDFIKILIMNVVADYLHSLEDGLFFKNLFSIPQFRFLQFWGTYRASGTTKPISKEMQKRLFYPKRPSFLKKYAPSLEFKTGRILDISRTLTTTLPVWPGSKPFCITTLKTNEKDGVHESEISLNIHTATHMDAPMHFVASGVEVAQISLEKMLGKVLVLEFQDKGAIERRFFESQIIPNYINKILLKTKNSTELFVDHTIFNKDFIAITKDAAKWLVEHNIELVGIDGPSIQLFHDADNSTHQILLSHQIIVIEGLNLEQVEPGIYTLIALPLKISHAEGAPLRAILIEGTL